MVRLESAPFTLSVNEAITSRSNQVVICFWTPVPPFVGFVFCDAHCFAFPEFVKPLFVHLRPCRSPGTTRRAMRRELSLSDVSENGMLHGMGMRLFVELLLALATVFLQLLESIAVCLVEFILECVALGWGDRGREGLLSEFGCTS